MGNAIALEFIREGSEIQPERAAVLTPSQASEGTQNSSYKEAIDAALQLDKEINSTDFQRFTEDLVSIAEGEAIYPKTSNGRDKAKPRKIIKRVSLEERLKRAREHTRLVFTEINKHRDLGIEYAEDSFKCLSWGIKMREPEPPKLWPDTIERLQNSFIRIIRDIDEKVGEEQKIKLLTPKGRLEAYKQIILTQYEPRVGYLNNAPDTNNEARNMIIQLSDILLGRAINPKTGKSLRLWSQRIEAANNLIGKLEEFTEKAYSVCQINKAQAERILGDARTALERGIYDNKYLQKQYNAQLKAQKTETHSVAFEPYSVTALPTAALPRMQSSTTTSAISYSCTIRPKPLIDIYSPVRKVDEARGRIDNWTHQSLEMGETYTELIRNYNPFKYIESVIPSSNWITKPTYSFFRSAWKAASAATSLIGVGLTRLGL